jgi:hypothetical protein
MDPWCLQVQEARCTSKNADINAEGQVRPHMH